MYGVIETKLRETLERADWRLSIYRDFIKAYKKNGTKSMNVLIGHLHQYGCDVFYYKIDDENKVYNEEWFNGYVIDEEESLFSLNGHSSKLSSGEEKKKLFNNVLEKMLAFE